MKTIQILKISLIGLFLLLLSIEEGIGSVSDQEGKPEVIVIENPEIARSEKEAILVLPGLGDGRKGRKHQQRFFQNKGYDLFIPDFHDRKSFDGSLENLVQFFETQKLREYKKLLYTWNYKSLFNQGWRRTIPN